jgi:hypothetical protein
MGVLKHLIIGAVVVFAAVCVLIEGAIVMHKINKSK